MTTNSPDQDFLAGLTVLLVEDEPDVREAMAEFLRRRVGCLLLATNGSEGLALFKEKQPAFVVTDILMPVMDGLTMAGHIMDCAPGTPILVVTAFGQMDYLMKAIEMGIDSYVVKPVKSELLENALLKCARALRLEAELALLRRQRLEYLQTQHEVNIGVLAGGLAHDYNNLLQSILVSLSLAKRCLQDTAEARECVEMTEVSWREARELGHRLSLLHPSPVEHRQCSKLEPLLIYALEEALEQTTCRPAFDLPDNMPELRFDEGQLETVFATLARNAAEAMKGTGTLHVRGRVLTIPEDNDLGLVAADYLHLSFRDEGPGILPEMMSVLFMPYASTKERGSDRGMGLSLAVSQAIMKLHRGALKAESHPGEGAIFHLYLPVPDPGLIK